MKWIFLVVTCYCLHSHGWSQENRAPTSYFKASWHFKNDFGYQLIISKGLFGIIDSNGIVVCEPQFDWIQGYDGNYAIVGLNGKKGVINQLGKTIVPTKFQEIDGARNGWITGRNHLEATYIDTNGVEWNGSMPNLHDFKEGPKRTMKKDHIVYVDKDGKVVIDDAYTRGDTFRNGYTIVGKDKQQFLIDEEGKILQTFNEQLVAISATGPYIEVWNNNRRGAYDFNGKVLIPCEYDEMKVEKGGIIQVKKNYKWGAYNGEFELIIPTVYDRINYIDDILGRNKKVMVYMGQLKGLIDFDGKTILECIYSEIQLNEDGSIITSLTPTDYETIQALEYVKQNDFSEYKRRIEEQYGYEIWDKNGAPLWNGKHFFAKQVHNNYFMISDLTGIYVPFDHRFHRNGPNPRPTQFYTIGSLIDVSTHETILDDYSDYSYVKDGVFACRDTNTLVYGYFEGFDVFTKADSTYPEIAFWKVVDLNGEEFPVPEGLSITNATSYGFEVCRKVENSYTYAYGMIDFEGNITIPVEYDEISHFWGSSFQIKQNGLYGIANPVAQTVGLCRYEWIINELPLSGLYFAGAKGKVGYIDPLGNEQIPCIYDSRRDDFRNGRTFFTLGNASIYLGKDGREVE